MLLAIGGYLYFQLKYKEHKLKTLLDNLNSLKSQYGSLLKKYNQTIGLLETKNETIKKLEEQNKKLESENYYLRLKLTNLESQYSNNDRIKFLIKAQNYNFTDLPLDKCTNNDTLNYACLVNIMQNKLGFSYKKESGDYLESVDEFIRTKGGDCEDWSLFAYSLIYYLARNGYKKITFYVKQNNSKLYLYKEGNTIYYLPNAKAYTIEIKNPSIVCYKINETLGHCITAICDKPLLPNQKNNCTYFEPQNGKILNPKELYIIVSNDFYFREWQFWK